MSGPLSPNELKARLADGMLSFPLTDFDEDDVFDARASAARLEWLENYRPTAFFMAGGAGEFFSLTKEEYTALMQTAVRTAGGRIPVVAGTGYGTRAAIDYAREAERLGADGLLLMPPYLSEGSQAGLYAHIAAICAATKLGVIVYNRANCRLTADTVAKLAKDCPTLIGFKDGVGDMETLTAIRKTVGDRLLFLNGMPTAESYAAGFKRIGIPVYSSAIFNFIPKTALAFLDALRADDHAAMEKIETDFLRPYVKLREREPGYAVSIVKAGVRAIGRSAGRVRPPLSDLTPQEYEELSALIAKAGPQ